MSPGSEGRPKIARQTHHAVLSRKVAGKEVSPVAASGDPVLERLAPVPMAGRKKDVEPRSGQGNGELAADAGRAAGDENGAER